MSLEFQYFNILKENFVRTKHFSLEFFHKYLYFKFMLRILLFTYQTKLNENKCNT